MTSALSEESQPEVEFRLEPCPGAGTPERVKVTVSGLPETQPSMFFTQIAAANSFITGGRMMLELTGYSTALVHE